MTVQFDPRPFTSGLIHIFHKKTRQIKLYLVATPKPVIKVEANSDERSQELIDVRVNVPYHQYKLYKSKNYTFWLMPKNMIGQPQFNRAILVQNPNPMEVEQFKTPEAPIKKENQKSLRNFLNDHEKNFSQVRSLSWEGFNFRSRKVFERVQYHVFGSPLFWFTLRNF